MMAGPAMIGGMAVLGGVAGALKSGPKRQVSDLERQAQQYSQQSLGAFANLVAAGPGQADVSRGVQSQRDLAALLQGYQSSGLYDMGQGNQIAQQAFAGQRMALSQAFQDQMQQASKSAQLAGRSSNDPILRAKLAQEQMRQGALLDANQSAAAVDFGRQFSMDRIGNATAATNVLAGLGNQAFANQQSLFGMGQTSLQNERNFSLQNAMYEQSRGGGLKGALTGAMMGAGAGMQMAQGFSAMSQNQQMADYMTNKGGQAGMNDLSGLNLTDEGFGGDLDATSMAVAGRRPAARPSAQVFGPPNPGPMPQGPVYGPPSPAPGQLRPDWANGNVNPYRSALYDVFRGGQGNVYAPMGGNSFSWK